MQSAVGIIFSLLLSVGGGAGIAFATFKYIWFAIGLLGVVGGFFAGSLLAAFLDASFGLNQLWFLIIVTVGFAIGGGFLAFKYTKGIVVLATAGIGSYAFMRSLTMFFGGYPSEAEMFWAMSQGIKLDFSWAFFLYLAIFAGAYFGTATYQFKQEEEHEALASYKRA